MSIQRFCKPYCKVERRGGNFRYIKIKPLGRTITILFLVNDQINPTDDILSIANFTK